MLRKLLREGCSIMDLSFVWSLISLNRSLFRVDRLVDARNDQRHSDCLALKIASLSSVTRESTPLSISKALPSSATDVVFHPSPEKMNTPSPREAVFRGLLSNCSVAFWMIVLRVPTCTAPCEAASVTTESKSKGRRKTQLRTSSRQECFPLWCSFKLKLAHC